MRYFFFFFLGSTTMASAQEIPERWRGELARIALWEKAFQYDSAATALTAMLQELRDTQLADGYWELLVWQKLANAQEQLGENALALKNLLTIIDVSAAKKTYDIWIKSYLSLALLQEKTGQLDSCYQSLQAAKDKIIQTRSDSLFPAFYIRLSSYFRQQKEPELAIDAARRALYWEERYPHPGEAATAHLLLGALYRETQPDTARQHLQWALDRWKKDGDGHGVAAVMHHLSRFYWRRKEYLQALAYNDSSLIHWKGRDYADLLPVLYQQRAAVFQLAGQSDSVLHYTHLHYQARESYQEGLARHSLAHIEAQYQNEKKKELIARQAEKLETEKRQRWGLFFVLTVVVILLIIIIFLYIHLRNKSKELIRQSRSLAATNQHLGESLKEREVLLSEIHHRVKNNLQIIVSLLELQAEQSEQSKTKNILLDAASRLYSIAGIHEWMYKNDGKSRGDLRVYLSVLLEHIRASMSGAEPPEMRLDLTDHVFNLDTLVPLGIILNELITNSLKHNKHQALQLSIRIQPQADGYLLRYADNGKGWPEPMQPNTGMHLLKSLARQLKGIPIYHNAEGAVFELFFKERKR